jgi:hypothetical protein
MKWGSFLLTGLCIWFGASDSRAAQFYLKVVDLSERAITGVTFTWRPAGGADFGSARFGGFSANNLGTGNGDTFYTLSQVDPNVNWSVSMRTNLANWSVSVDGTRPYWGTLKVARTGYVPKELRVEAQDGFIYWRRIELRLIPTISTGQEIDREDWVTPGVIPATVVDNQGVAVAGAVVRVTNEFGNVYTSTTDSNGRANVTLINPGRWTAVAEKSGYTSNTRTGSNYPGDTTSSVSLTLTAASTGGIPAAPSSVTATAASSSVVNLSWTDVSGETLYRIQRRTGTGAFAAFTTNSANATTSSDTSVAAGTSYTYQVRAENASGNSSYTVSNTVTTPAASSPAPNPTPAPNPAPSPSPSQSSSSGGGGGGAPSIWFISALSLLGIARYFRSKR